MNERTSSESYLYKFNKHLVSKKTSLIRQFFKSSAISLMVISYIGCATVPRNDTVVSGDHP
jgi:hypothetical protein